MDFVERRLGSVAAVRGYGYTHDCDAIDAGPALSAYKTLDTMIDKMNGQLDLGHRLRGVDVRTVASSVVRSHFLPDLRGEHERIRTAKGSVPKVRPFVSKNGRLLAVASNRRKPPAKDWRGSAWQSLRAVCVEET